jgi:hypothetical protein
MHPPYLSYHVADMAAREKNTVFQQTPNKENLISFSVYLEEI